MCSTHTFLLYTSNTTTENLELLSGYVFGPGPEVINLFSCSTQLSTNFFLLINVKMPTIVGIFTFMSNNNNNNILGLSEPEQSKIFGIFFIVMRM